MRSLFLAVISLTTFLHAGLSQNVIPSSSSLQAIRGANASGLYTGQPNVYVPLFELPGRQMTLPIGLSYNARGIKVDEISGPFGMGWSLQAGGMISRITRGLPDEDLAGMCSRDNHDIASSINADIANGIVDGEPDIFYYSFPGGSGKFFIEYDDISEEAIAYTIPYRDIKIDLTQFCSEGIAFTIIDEVGTKYYYSTQESSKTNISTQVENNISEVTGLPEISTWHLTSIHNANGRREFSFTYFDDRPNTFAERSRIVTAYNVLTDPGYCAGSSHKLTTQTIETFNYLKIPNSIESDFGRIDFVYSAERLDSEDKVIQHIKLTNQDDEEISRYVFDMDYWRFQTQGNGNNHELMLALEANGECAEKKCQRLYLDRVHQVGGDSSIVFRDFSYYDASALPPRGSRYKDHWGYATYNASLNIYSGDPGFVPRIKVGTRYFGGVDKEPTSSLGIAQSGLLSSMVLPTGGSVSYEYEKTTGSPIASSPIAFESWYDYYNSTLGPGVRIKTITVSAGDQYTNDLTTTYQYKGGRFSKPYYAWKINKGPIEVDGNVLYDCEYKVYLAISSQSQKALYDLNGTPIGYNKVIETRSDGARSEYYYTNQEFEDVAPTVERYVYQGNEQSPIPIEISPEGPPFTYYNSQSWKRGLLRKLEAYDSESNLVSRTINTFDFSLNNKKMVKAKKVQWEVGQNFVLSEYELVSHPFHKSQTESLVSDQDHRGNLLTQSTTFTHDQEYNYLKEKAMVSSDGTLHKTVFSYPFDYSTSATSNDPESQGIHELKIRHMHGIPIEIIKYRGSMVENAAFNSYKKYGPNVYPFRIYSLQNDDLLDTSSDPEDYSIAYISAGDNSLVIDEKLRWTNENLQFHAETGNLTLSHTYDGMIIEREYDIIYENNYLTKELVYPLSMVSSCVSSGNINIGCVLNADKPGARVATYTYKPLVGPLSETDINGRKTHYEYDHFNRVKLIRDNEDNIVQKYEYKLLQQSGTNP